MILTFSIVLIVLTVTLWLSTMYAAWKAESGVLTPFSTAPFAQFSEKIKRIGRRIYYRVMLDGKVVAGWTNKRMSTVFFKLFPDAEPAFAKRNTLAGLKEGPTSYFLMSISETKTEPQKITRRRRKIV